MGISPLAPKYDSTKRPLSQRLFKNIDITLTINGSEFTEFTQQVTVSGDLTISTSSTRKYGLTFDADEGAVISVARNGIPLTEGYHLYYGDTLTLSVSAESGHKITSLYVSGASSDGSGLTRTLTVTGDVVITARTRQIPLLNISTDTGTWLTYKKVLRDPILQPTATAAPGIYPNIQGKKIPKAYIAHFAPRLRGALFPGGLPTGFYFCTKSGTGTRKRFGAHPAVTDQLSSSASIPRESSLC